MCVCVLFLCVSVGHVASGLSGLEEKLALRLV